MAVTALVWTVTGTDYEAVAESTGSQFNGVVLAVSSAALFIALLTARSADPERQPQTAEVY